MEAFQNMSAFFIHDLKNLASRLSLTVQNLPVHFDKPEFREEALGVISHSVDKIKEICTRLTLLKQKVELHPREVDLNEIVKSVVEEFKGNWKGELVENLEEMPAVRLDPEQIQKVIVNLILNAVEASGDEGKIRVQTGASDGRIILQVADTGCGMSPEFVEKQLFHPFRTTKKQGMGIGLFHSKVIVEEHGGRIEVETQPGEGTTFRVVLPTQ
ncbi:MAG TPA: ATP-binding protein, partial [Acidobacteriota bacterium]|nr:ATP-binding protein [Acidobacteriota bacterium]